MASLLFFGIAIPVAMFIIQYSNTVFLVLALPVYRFKGEGFI
jgi:hypothetical protein